MQSESTSAWRLELGDNADEEETREQRKIVVLALLDRLSGQIEALYQDAAEANGRYTDERDERIVEAFRTLQILRGEAEALLSTRPA